MKKFLLVMLTLVMITGLLMACGGGTATPNPPSGDQATGQPAGNTDKKDDVKTDRAVFTVGFDKEFPPMGYVADNGDFVGFDLDLAAEVAERMGMDLKLQPIGWAAKDMELESGNIDCVWNGFTITEDRKTEYTWTQPYMNNNQVVVTMPKNNINSLADLAGKIVAVQDDSSALNAIEDNATISNIIGQLIKTETNLGALMELESGAVDAIVMDEIVARFNIEKKGAGYIVLDEAVGAEVFGIGFKLGNTELRDKVENSLLEMRADGKLAEISEDWFGKDVTTIGK